MNTLPQNRLGEVIARYAAIESAMSQTQGVRGPRFARCCAALVALAARDAPDVVAARAGEQALALHGARGVSGSIRPVYAAALAVANRRADDYVAARTSLLPALRDRRAGLPLAALAYALAGHTTLGKSELQRIWAIAPLAATPWWTAARQWNGFFAAALALRDETPDALAAHLQAARRALGEVRAPDHLMRNEARRIVLAGADPVAVAQLWLRLDNMRRSLRPKPRRDLLLAYAARAAGLTEETETAARTFAAALDATSTLRPRPAHLIRPAIAAGFATAALSPERGGELDVMGPVEAAALVIAAQHAAAAAAAGGAAAAAASG